MSQNVADFAVTTLQGETTTFGELTGGKVALVVNVASRCGLSNQYEGLEKLHKQYADQGFTVVGFPSNQFLQELKGHVSNFGRWVGTCCLQPNIRPRERMRTNMKGDNPTH